ncbi:MAG: tRNA pseudouridine(55) synthase TruB [Bacilli bacterium]|jgi:tRNA pseudouridine55 synthase|nr:tRNA pseudouridine(55) synthase TruB [Bacilli bacterium]MDD4056976.1 tRNA pseudouridine(55) synthase TruB [Bacilli bacterium]MDY0209162.1 tRNA pseudouridine(55) synthase TruB [Bacilli bacterium]
MDGIVLINKEQGLTSQDVVSRVKRLLNLKKVGHAGTLDPLATGVVVVLLEEATKLSNYLLNEEKVYEAEITIGVATDTEDATGKIIDSKKVLPIEIAAIDRVLADLVGELEQIPPMFSAIKTSGKKLYELARQGLSIPRAARRIEIRSLTRTSEAFYEQDVLKFSFITRVTKGTYIRTLCTEIGARLQYPAHMSALKRLASGKFTLEQCVKLEDIASGNFKMICPLAAMSDQKIVKLDNQEYQRVKNGMTLESKEKFSDCDLIVLEYQDKLVAIYKKDEKGYRAERVWN